MTRLPDEIPTKKSVKEFRNTRTKKLRGQQKLAWMKLVEKGISPLGMTIEQAFDQAQVNKVWSGLIKQISRAEQRHVLNTRNIPKVRKFFSQ